MSANISPNNNNNNGTNDGTNNNIPTYSTIPPPVENPPSAPTSTPPGSSGGAGGGGGGHIPPPVPPSSSSSPTTTKTSTTSTSQQPSTLQDIFTNPLQILLNPLLDAAKNTSHMEVKKEAYHLYSTKYQSPFVIPYELPPGSRLYTTPHNFQQTGGSARSTQPSPQTGFLVIPNQYDPRQVALEIESATLQHFDRTQHRNFAITNNAIHIKDQTGNHPSEVAAAAATAQQNQTTATPQQPLLPTPLITPVQPLIGLNTPTYTHTPSVVGNVKPTLPLLFPAILTAPTFGLTYYFAKKSIKRKITDDLIQLQYQQPHLTIASIENNTKNVITNLLNNIRPQFTRAFTTISCVLPLLELSVATTAVYTFLNQVKTKRILDEEFKQDSKLTRAIQYQPGVVSPLIVCHADPQYSIHPATLAFLGDLKIDLPKNSDSDMTTDETSQPAAPQTTTTTNKKPKNGSKEHRVQLTKDQLSKNSQQEHAALCNVAVDVPIPIPSSSNLLFDVFDANGQVVTAFSGERNGQERARQEYIKQCGFKQREKGIFRFLPSFFSTIPNDTYLGLLSAGIIIFGLTKLSTNLARYTINRIYNDSTLLLRNFELQQHHHHQAFNTGNTVNINANVIQDYPYLAKLSQQQIHRTIAEHQLKLTNHTIKRLTPFVLARVTFATLFAAYYYKITEQANVLTNTVQNQHYKQLCGVIIDEINNNNNSLNNNNNNNNNDNQTDNNNDNDNNNTTSTFNSSPSLLLDPAIVNDPNTLTSSIYKNILIQQQCDYNDIMHHHNVFIDDITKLHYKSLGKYHTLLQQAQAKEEEKENQKQGGGKKTKKSKKQRQQQQDKQQQQEDDNKNIIKLLPSMPNTIKKEEHEIFLKLVPKLIEKICDFNKTHRNMREKLRYDFIPPQPTQDIIDNNNNRLHQYFTTKLTLFATGQGLDHLQDKNKQIYEQFKQQQQQQAIEEQQKQQKSIANNELAKQSKDNNNNNNNISTTTTTTTNNTTSTDDGNTTQQQQQQQQQQTLDESINTSTIPSSSPSSIDTIEENNNHTIITNENKNNNNTIQNQQQQNNNNIIINAFWHYALPPLPQPILHQMPSVEEMISWIPPMKKIKVPKELQKMFPNVFGDDNNNNKNNNNNNTQNDTTTTASVSNNTTTTTSIVTTTTTPITTPVIDANVSIENDVNKSEDITPQAVVDTIKVVDTPTVVDSTTTTNNETTTTPSITPILPPTIEKKVQEEEKEKEAVKKPTKPTFEYNFYNGEYSVLQGILSLLMPTPFIRPVYPHNDNDDIIITTPSSSLPPTSSSTTTTTTTNNDNNNNKSSLPIPIDETTKKTIEEVEAKVDDTIIQATIDQSITTATNTTVIQENSIDNTTKTDIIDTDKTKEENKKTTTTSSASSTSTTTPVEETTVPTTNTNTNNNNNNTPRPSTLPPQVHQFVTPPIFKQLITHTKLYLDQQQQQQSSSIEKEKEENQQKTIKPTIYMTQIVATTTQRLFQLLTFTTLLSIPAIYRAVYTSTTTTSTTGNNNNDINIINYLKSQYKIFCLKHNKKYQKLTTIQQELGAKQPNLPPSPKLSQHPWYIVYQQIKQEIKQQPKTKVLQNIFLKNSNNSLKLICKYIFFYITLGYLCNLQYNNILQDIKYSSIPEFQDQRSGVLTDNITWDNSILVFFDKTSPHNIKLQNLTKEEKRRREEKFKEKQQKEKNDKFGTNTQSVKRLIDNALKRQKEQEQKDKEKETEEQLANKLDENGNLKLTRKERLIRFYNRWIAICLTQLYFENQPLEKKFISKSALTDPQSTTNLLFPLWKDYEYNQQQNIIIEQEKIKMEELLEKNKDKKTIGVPIPILSSSSSSNSTSPNGSSGSIPSSSSSSTTSNKDQSTYISMFQKPNYHYTHILQKSNTFMLLDQQNVHQEFNFIYKQLHYEYKKFQKEKINLLNNNNNNNNEIDNNNNNSAILTNAQDVANVINNTQPITTSSLDDDNNNNIKPKYMGIPFYHLTSPL